ncbi:MAG TPA: hypothetical protein VK167_00315 [Flavipsychrobacter sp.]|nr:hypothetical protein [Flavipsychrobacter sp.]
MLNLAEKDISCLRTLLGYSLRCYSSARLSIYDKYSVSYDGVLALRFSRANEHKTMVLKGMDFFESLWGKIYHDYSIEYENTTSDNAEVYLNTSPIIEIGVYGKEYNPEEFKAYPSVYAKQNEVKTTDEVFIFKCKNGENITVGFDSISPSIDVWHYNNIEHYVTLEDDKPYTLNYSITINS